MKDRGNVYSNTDKEEFLQMFGDNTVYIGERPESFESPMEWAESTFKSVYGDPKITTDEKGREVQLYGAEKVIAVPEDFSSITVFDDSRSDEFQVHNVSEYLGGNIPPGVDLGVEEVMDYSIPSEDSVEPVITEILGALDPVIEDNNEWIDDLESYFAEYDVDATKTGNTVRIEGSEFNISVGDDCLTVGVVGKDESRHRNYSYQTVSKIRSEEDLETFLEELN